MIRSADRLAPCADSDNKLDLEELKQCKQVNTVPAVVWLMLGASQEFLEAYEEEGADEALLDTLFNRELTRQEFQQLYLEVPSLLTASLGITTVR